MRVNGSIDALEQRRDPAGAMHGSHRPRDGCDVRTGRGDEQRLPAFAAGEIMAGNILGQGYLAGFGMTLGTVFGRIAGKEAARALH